MLLAKLPRYQYHSCYGVFMIKPILLEVWHTIISTIMWHFFYTHYYWLYKMSIQLVGKITWDGWQGPTRVVYNFFNLCPKKFVNLLIVLWLGPKSEETLKKWSHPCIFYWICLSHIWFQFWPNRTFNFSFVIILHLNLSYVLSICLKKSTRPH